MSGDRTVIEVTTLTVSAEQSAAFEHNLREALVLLRRAEGCLQATAARSHENPDRYLLLARWRTLDDHLAGFREGPDFRPFRNLLVPFYVKPPRMEHFIEAAAD